MEATRTAVFALSLAVAVISLAPGRACATWPHDPVNGNVPLCTVIGEQSAPAAVSDGAGGLIVAWHDRRSGNYDIYAQRVNADGVPLWTANGVALCTAAGEQLSPALASDGAGGAIVSWYDRRSGSNTDIYSQRVDAAGVPQWTPGGVALCTAAGDQYNPAIVAANDGGGIVTWYDSRGSAFHIYAQEVSSTGVPQWTANGAAICTATGDQLAPMIAPDGAGGAIITWFDSRSTVSYDVYAQRLGTDGVAQWAVNGVPICTAPGNQFDPVVVADGTGGAIVTWQDFREGSSGDIYAQRVVAAGSVAWIANGVAICSATSDQQYPTIVSDGAEGCIISWYDFRSGNNDIYTQRVNGAGTPQWIDDGVPLCTEPDAQTLPTMIADGVGGAIVTWNDQRSGTGSDIYAQRVNSFGATQWTSNGSLLCGAPGGQLHPAIASDGSSGAIVAWNDDRNPGGWDIYAQRVERFGHLGNPEPLIDGVHDVVGDQGGFVKLGWHPSYLDDLSDPSLAGYDVYRSAPGVQPYAWEYLGTVSATHLQGVYEYIAPTTEDSTSAGRSTTHFKVVGRNESGSVYWDSEPDSGYSVDNLFPSAPSSFAGDYAAGSTHLHWSPNSESDIAGYHLYRGSSAGFAPDPGNLVATVGDTAYSDIGAAGSYYKLSALDIHGNESDFSLLTPTQTSSVTGVSDPQALRLGPITPNPARTSAELHYALPRTAMVGLAVYDPMGRHVRTLTSGLVPAGEYSLAWDLRDDGGRLIGAGLYFVRLTALGRTLVRRTAVLP